MATPRFMPSTAVLAGFSTGSRIAPLPTMTPPGSFAPPGSAPPGPPPGPPPAPTCTLPSNPNYGKPGVNDPYFASQADHDAWVAANNGCPPPPYLPDTQQQQPPASTLAPAPTLVSPPDAASVPAGPVIFKWTADPTAKTSNVRVCSGPNGTGTCNTTATNPGDTSVSIPLTAGAYYWSMNSTDADGAIGPWSADKTITVTGSALSPGQTPPTNPSAEPSLGTIAVIVGLSATVIWLLYQQTQQADATTEKSPSRGDSNRPRSASRTLRTERTRQ